MLRCSEFHVAIATAEGDQHITVNTTDYTKLTNSKKIINLDGIMIVVLE